MPLIRTAAILAGFSAAMWFAWLGWGNHKSYSAFQVVACGLCVVGGAVLAFLKTRRHNFGVVVVLAASSDWGFAVPWALDAAPDDDTGLWMVGLITLLLGVGLGLTVLLSVVAAILGVRQIARNRR